MDKPTPSQSANRPKPAPQKLAAALKRNMARRKAAPKKAPAK